MRGGQRERRHGEALIDAWHAKRISPGLAVMELILTMRDVGEIERFLEAQSNLDGTNDYGELLRLLADNREGCLRVAQIARRLEALPLAESTLDERLEATKNFFDAAVGDCEVASVALYTLGNADALHEATEEVVATMAGWGLVGPGQRFLEIGSGVGRFPIALAPRVASAVGVDVAPAMIAAARRRAAGLSNVRFEVGSGLDLAWCDDDAFDVVLAVDTMPYLVDAGMSLVETHFREAARVLAPRGELVIFAFSYRSELGVDRRDVSRLAADHGFRVVIDGDARFDLWDGQVFRLQRLP